MQHVLHVHVPWHGVQDLHRWLALLQREDERQIAGGGVPRLMQSGVRYRAERRRRNGEPRENWLTASEVFRRGCGDCEDLAAWRAAELRHGGIDARAILVPSPIGYHCVVRMPDGRIDDPSRALGMRSGKRRR